MCYYKWDKSSGTFVESSQAPAAAQAADPAATAASGAQPGMSPWQKLIDPSTNAEYYYNSATGQSQWTPPPEVVGTAATAPVTLQENVASGTSTASVGPTNAVPTNSQGAAAHLSKKKQPGAVKMTFGLGVTGGKKNRRAPALQAFGSIEDVAAPSAELQEVLRKQAHRAKVCDYAC